MYKHFSYNLDDFQMKSKTFHEKGRHAMSFPNNSEKYRSQTHGMLIEFFQNSPFSPKINVSTVKLTPFNYTKSKL